MAEKAHLRIGLELALTAALCLPAAYAALKAQTDPVVVGGLAVVVLSALASFALRARGFSAPPQAAPERAGAASFEDDKRKFSGLLGVANRLLREQIVDNTKFAEGLAHASREASSADPAEPVAKILLTLINDNREMSRKLTKLSERLNEAREKVAELQANLLEAEEANLTDKLTEIGNRAFLDTALLAEMARARGGAPLCVIMIDVDHFKRINDGFGHLVGDQLLKHFAALVRHNVKSSDKVARFGGEEFAVVLPATTLEEAYDVAERLRKHFEEKVWVVGRKSERIGSVTASFGVARYAAGETMEELIERADKLLYESKASGRNRVTVQRAASAPDLMVA
jgi:diguanylate cyclase